jgi:hypothetical protein
LQEFSEGEARRDTYLNPDAQHLGSQFKMLASDGRGDLYIASGNHVLRLNEARELVGYAESGAIDADVKAIAASGDSVWFFGDDRGGASMQKVWVERIQF